MNYTQFAEKFVEKAGLNDHEAYGGMLGQDVMEVVKLISSQWHSGMSFNIIMSSLIWIADAYEDGNHEIWREYKETDEWKALEKKVLDNIVR